MGIRNNVDGKSWKQLFRWPCFSTESQKAEAATRASDCVDETMGSIEQKVSLLECQIRQLSNDIESYIAKDKELLARLRTGRGTWRALRRAQELSLHPYDEPPPEVLASSRKGGDDSATTDAVVLSQSATVDEHADPDKLPFQICGRDAKSV